MVIWCKHLSKPSAKLLNGLDAANIRVAVCSFAMLFIGIFFRPVDKLVCKKVYYANISLSYVFEVFCYFNFTWLPILKGERYWGKNGTKAEMSFGSTYRYVVSLFCSYPIL